MDLVNSIYFTVVTLFTVGYGDIVPITPIAKIFVVVFIVFGMGAFLTALTSISGDIASKRILDLTSKLEKIEEEMNKVKVILIGSGGVNLSLAEKFEKEKVKYVLLLSDKTEAEKLSEKGIKAYAINLISEDEIKKFRPERVKNIIVDMQNTSDMLYVILILTELAKDSKIIAIVHNEDLEKRLESVKKIKDITIINPSKQVANELFSSFKAS
jgi:voltage-gated potassium channel